jgi:hypothetical protein
VQIFFLQICPKTVMGIPDNLVVHNLIPGTGSYFYTDKRIQLKNTSTAKLRRRQAVVTPVDISNSDMKPGVFMVPRAAGSLFKKKNTVTFTNKTSIPWYYTGQAIPNEKKNFYQQVLKLGTNEASAQGLQNVL